MSADCENASETNKDKLDEILNKVNRCNKNVKMVIEMLERVKGANEARARPMSNAQSGYVAKDSSEYKNKKQVYLTKLNNKEIKQPRPETLKFYEIDYDEDAEKYV